MSTVPSFGERNAIADLMRLKADLAEAESKVEYDQDAMAETQMLATQWMKAHDCLKAGKPYDLPKPSDLPDEIQRLNAIIEALTHRISDEPAGDDRLRHELALIGMEYAALGKEREAATITRALAALTVSASDEGVARQSEWREALAAATRRTIRVDAGGQWEIVFRFKTSDDAHRFSAALNEQPEGCQP